MNTEPRKRDIALVVDDSPETLRMLTEALDGAGMTVMVALDGAAAMRIVEQITPDIILLDAVMPARLRVKAEAGLSYLPVAAVLVDPAEAGVLAVADRAVAVVMVALREQLIQAEEVVLLNLAVQGLSF